MMAVSTARLLERDRRTPSRASWVLVLVLPGPGPACKGRNKFQHHDRNKEIRGTHPPWHHQGLKSRMKRTLRKKILTKMRTMIEEKEIIATETAVLTA
jgi:hypothetical protein